MNDIGTTLTLRKRSLSLPNLINRSERTFLTNSSGEPDSFETSEASSTSSSKKFWGQAFTKAISKITSWVKSKPRSLDDDDKAIAEEQIGDVKYSEIIDELKKVEKDQTETNKKLNEIEKDLEQAEQTKTNIAKENNRISKKVSKKPQTKKNNKKKIKNNRTNIQTTLKEIKDLKTEKDKLEQKLVEIKENKNKTILSTNANSLKNKRELNQAGENIELNLIINQAGKGMIKTKQTSTTEYEKIVDNTLQKLFNERKNGNINSKAYAELVEKLCQNIARANNDNVPNTIADYERLIHQILEKAPTYTVKKETYKTALKYMVEYLEATINQAGYEIKMNKDNFFVNCVLNGDDVMEEQNKLTDEEYNKKLIECYTLNNAITKNTLQKLSDEQKNGIINSKAYEYLIGKLCQNIAIANDNYAEDTIDDYDKLVNLILDEKTPTDAHKKETFKIVMKNIVEFTNKSFEETIKDASLKKTNYDAACIKNSNNKHNFDKFFSTIQNIFQKVINNDMEILIKRDMNEQTSKNDNNPQRQLITDFMTALNGLNDALLFHVEDLLLHNADNTFEKAYIKTKGEILYAKTPEKYNELSEAKDEVKDSDEFKNIGYKYTNELNKYLLDSIGRMKSIPDKKLVNSDFDRMYQLSQCKIRTVGSQPGDFIDVLNPAAAFNKTKQYIQNPDLCTLPTPIVEKLKNSLPDNIPEKTAKYEKIINDYTQNVQRLLSNGFDNDLNANTIGDNDKKRIQEELKNYTYRLISIAFINFKKIADQDTTENRQYCARLKHTLNVFIKFYNTEFGTLDSSVNSAYKNCQNWIGDDIYNDMDNEKQKQYDSFWEN